MKKEMCNIKELANYLNVSIPFIRKLIYAKRIPYYKIGNRIKFDIKEINGWVEIHKINERQNAYFI